MTNATQQGSKSAAPPAGVAGTAQAAPLGNRPKAPEKKPAIKRDAVYYRAKLQEVQGRLGKVSEEITLREKKNEGVGNLLRQRRSLRSWEARFQKHLKVG